MVCETFFDRAKTPNGRHLKQRTRLGGDLQNWAGGRPFREIHPLISTPLLRRYGMPFPSAGTLGACHPFCAETNVLSWPGDGSRDTITYLSGFTYTRNFVAWFEGVGYDIELGDRPNTTARVLWRIENNSNNKSMLSIEVVPFIKTELSDEKKRQYIERLFGPILQHYLDCVVRGYDYHVTTGKSVTSNQFGRNPHYSAR